MRYEDFKALFQESFGVFSCFKVPSFYLQYTKHPLQQRVFCIKVPTPFQNITFTIH